MIDIKLISIVFDSDLEKWLKSIDPRDAEWIRKCIVEHCPAVPPSWYPPPEHPAISIGFALCWAAILSLAAIYIFEAFAQSARRERYTVGHLQEAIARINMKLNWLPSFRDETLRLKCKELMRDMLHSIDCVLYELYQCHDLHRFGPNRELRALVSRTIKESHKLRLYMSHTLLLLSFRPLFFKGHRRTMNAVEIYQNWIGLIDLYRSRHEEHQTGEGDCEFLPGDCNGNGCAG